MVGLNIEAVFKNLASPNFPVDLFKCKNCICNVLGFSFAQQLDSIWEWNRSYITHTHSCIYRCDKILGRLTFHDRRPIDLTEFTFFRPLTQSLAFTQFTKIQTVFEAVAFKRNLIPLCTYCYCIRAPSSLLKVSTPVFSPLNPFLFIDVVLVPA